MPLLPSMEAVEQRKAELEEAGAKGWSRKTILDACYTDPSRREKLFREYQEVASFAAENGYSLSDPEDRARMHRDLLSYIRPEARDVLLTVAEAYHRHFGRLLPVTSVIRTERYQRRLGGVNPKATRVEIPPHTTGEAFDISYRYMAADEQNFVMDVVAKLEDEQKVEALRENRGHIHVYAFAGRDRRAKGKAKATVTRTSSAPSAVTDLSSSAAYRRDAGVAGACRGTTTRAVALLPFPAASTA